MSCHWLDGANVLQRLAIGYTPERQFDFSRDAALLARFAPDGRGPKKARSILGPYKEGTNPKMVYKAPVIGYGCWPRLSRFTRWLRQKLLEHEYRMRDYWHKNYRRRLVAAVMLLGLLLQVQTVFACQMADMAGPVHECCCEEMRSADDQIDLEVDTCCEFSNELTFKSIDPDKEPPVVLPKQPSHDMPEVAAYLVLAAIWPEDILAEVATAPFGAELTSPGTPGTKTYLSTLRLRI